MVSLMVNSIDFQNLKSYRKTPNISPGLIEIHKHILGSLYSGGLIFGGAYIRRA